MPREAIRYLENAKKVLKSISVEDNTYLDEVIAKVLKLKCSRKL